MPLTLFFAILIVLCLAAIVAEYAWGRLYGKAWHDGGDTLSNLNLAAGNLVIGTVTGGMILAGYGGLYALRPVDLSDVLPSGVYWVLGFLLAELLQYWNHRLSHRWNILVWGHITHHSSSHVNLTTAVRINWFYRAYAWLLYAPLPLLGYGFREFVLFQAIMNVYNMFMHTRLDIPFGPLGQVLVTPRSHRLHHCADPRYFGNYGASLIIWDRLFGTYRELSPGVDEASLPFGIDQNVDEGNPLRLNFHYLQELYATARAQGRSFLGLLLSDIPPDPSARPSTTSARAGSPARWVGGLAVVGFAIGINQLHGDLSPAIHGLGVAAGLALVVAYGLWLEPTTVREPETSP